MQYTVTINQAKALEWGLNAQQALLFAFVYECPSWANKVKTDGGEFFALSKAKIVEELPLLTDKPDTAYRLLIALRDAGLIDLSSTSNITLIRLTVKAKEWNRKLDGSEKYPTSDKAEGRKKIRGGSEKNPIKVGKKSEQGRKNIRRGSEKSPTNQVTSNQGTNQVTSNQDLPEGSDKPNQPGTLVLVVDQTSGPRVEIPADMPGPKDQTCKTFKAWANYAMAYRKRYQCWPVWNAAAGGILGKLVDRLGVDVAHSVAAYYLTINDSRIVNDCHSLTNLIAKAEAYHTQWATGRQMNSRTARQIEDTQANMNAAQEAARLILDGEKRNAFL
ncbi:phage replication protein [Pseudomonas sp. GBPI_506]|uniref:phage replication protein n=1 Tax=Pseudomonas sp. GBPI_506 TaxID=1735795 RepID=UPI0020CEFAAD|nr:phage replication protein [Pseudomonas sp. GBPI_506]MCP9731557.1 phage replication protein [Pseudomonas sp. GBPI_506]